MAGFKRMFSAYSTVVRRKERKNKKEKEKKNQAYKVPQCTVSIRHYESLKLCGFLRRAKCWELSIR